MATGAYNAIFLTKKENKIMELDKKDLEFMLMLVDYEITNHQYTYRQKGKLNKLRKKLVKKVALYGVGRTFKTVEVDSELLKSMNKLKGEKREATSFITYHIDAKIHLPKIN